MQYLVDSDWAIDYLNGFQSTIRKLDDLFPLGVGISVISLAEIYDGMYGSANVDQQERRLQELVDPMEVLNVDDAICRIFAQERRRLRSIGSLIGDMDLLIAATAIRNSVTLLTNNRRHFERVQGLSIIHA